MLKLITNQESSTLIARGLRLVQDQARALLVNSANQREMEKAQRRYDSATEMLRTLQPAIDDYDDCDFKTIDLVLDKPQEG